jgi:hypothetical protein
VNLGFGEFLNRVNLRVLKTYSNNNAEISLDQFPALEYVKIIGSIQLLGDPAGNPKLTKISIRSLTFDMNLDQRMVQVSQLCVTYPAVRTLIYLNPFCYNSCLALEIAGWRREKVLSKSRSLSWVKVYKVVWTRI